MTSVDPFSMTLEFVPPAHFDATERQWQQHCAHVFAALQTTLRQDGSYPQLNLQPSTEAATDDVKGLPEALQ
jgi:hypothetical protein